MSESSTGLLPITAEQIRLLSLHRDPTTGAPLFRLDTHVKAECALDYIAISYAWEHDGPTQELELEDGSCLTLSPTLASLLDAMRAQHEQINLWIDAICINQSDNVEKAAQVRSMSEVYTNAKQVLIWLDGADDEATAAWRYILSKRHLSWPKGWEHDAADHHQLRVMLPLLDRPWFKRLWVIQEAVLGREVVFTYDKLPPASFLHFSHCIYAMWRYCEDISAADWDAAGQEGLRCFSRLLAIRRVYLRNRQVPYELLLQAGRLCQTTDPRDRVFGLQGIVAPCELAPSPDYSVPMADVKSSGCLDELHEQLSKALLCDEATGLDSLALAGLSDRGSHSDLPSWVVNLEDVDDSEPLTSANGGSWNAGGTVSTTLGEPSAGKLLIPITYGDEVVRCCRPFDFENLDDLKLCMLEIADSWHSLKGRSANDWASPSSWHETVMTTMVMGLNIDDETFMTADDRSSFETWVRTVMSDRVPGVDDLHQSLFHRTAYLRINGWRIGFTSKGSMFVGPAMLEEGDRICVVPGCRFPLALRYLETSVTADRELAGMELRKPECQLISWCYVDGWMHGERSGSGQASEEMALL